MTEKIPVHVVFRFPFKRPQDFQPLQVKPFETTSLEEQVWRWLLAVPGPDRPLDILAELEEDEVTFDWELLATTLGVPLADVFAAASTLFERHMGRRLALVDDSNIHMAESDTGQIRSDVATGMKAAEPVLVKPISSSRPALPSVSKPSLPLSSPSSPSSSPSLPSSKDRLASDKDFERTGLKSVESLGGQHLSDGPASPAVELSTVTPDGERSAEQMERHAAAIAAESDRSMQTASVLTERLSRVRQSPTGSGPAVLQHTATQRHQISEDENERELDMRQSLIAEAMLSRVQQQTQAAADHTSSTPPALASTTANTAASAAVDDGNTSANDPANNERRPASVSSSFSDLSNSSLTESAMQDALISEAMNASTAMSSLLGSRMFPWAKKK
ncbi:hypothetical protein GGI12_000127 [Dipsacomyces acuminosporus]|nr:hypothetical protein GGI12_000127 [Dipsacomyces acuminosporus]